MTYGADKKGKGHMSEVERGLSLPRLTTIDQLTESLQVELVDMVNFPERGVRNQVLELTRWMSPEQVLALREWIYAQHPQLKDRMNALLGDITHEQKHGLQREPVRKKKTTRRRKNPPKKSP